MTGATGTSQEGSPWALPVWGMGGAGAGPEVLAGPGTGPWTGMERDLVALGQASSGWQIWPLPWLLWVVGLAVCVAVFSGIYIRCLREFKMSLPLQNACTENWLESHRLRRKLQIRQSDRVGTPISYGILRPVILLPKSMDWGNSRSMEHILEHELVHIQRFDLVGKLLVLAGVCVHWFNPLAWVMWVLFNRDVELTCDEEVVRNLGEDARSAYAMTLIGMEEGKLGVTPFYNGFGRNAIQERIKSLMKRRKMTVAAIIGAVVLVAVVGMGFMTSADGQDGEAGRPSRQEKGKDGKTWEGGGTGENREDGSGPTGTGQGTGVTGGHVASTKAPEVVQETAGNLVSQMFASQRDDKYVDWRVTSLEIVFTYLNLDGMKLEIYRMNYQYLAEKPEDVVLAGGMEMDEEGWVTLQYPGSTYLVFQDAGRELRYVTWMMVNDCFPGDDLFTEELQARIQEEKLKGYLLDELKAYQKEEGSGLEDVETLMTVWLEDGTYEIVQVALTFATAYLDGDRRSMRPYLTEDYGDNLEVYEQEGDGNCSVQRISGTGQARDAQEGDEIWISVEIAEEGLDALRYLSLECVKQEEGWKIQFYGLEG